MDNPLAQTEDKRCALVERAKEYMADAVADNTKLAYNSDWYQFATWCDGVGFQALPAEPPTVAAYFSAMADAGRRVSTIERARAGIRMAHRAIGAPDPTANDGVRHTLDGIRRTVGKAKTKKAPFLSADIRAMVGALPDSLSGVRDRALILIGFAGAFRRSEVVAIRVEDIEFTAEGVKILLPKSKTDQEKEGRHIGIKCGSRQDTCPVRALTAWLEASGIESGPVFRRIDRHGRILEPLSPQTVALVVKRAATAAGLDPAKYSGHSLRAGFVTQGVLNGASVTNIMRQTGHKSSDTVQGYVRIAQVFQDNVSGLLGL